jgi:hypothetical protein
MNAELRVTLWMAIAYVATALLLNLVFVAAPDPLDAASQRMLGGGFEYALAIFVVAFVVIGKAPLAAWRFHIGGSRLLRGTC